MRSNDYDDPDFFLHYSRLERSTRGLAGAPEWPTLQKLLPPMSGLRVLDLGCGFGWFCRWAAAEGAQSVIGLDLSEKMLGEARRATDDERIRYERADLEDVDLSEAGIVDLVFSSLAFHYVRDLAGLFGRLHRWLGPDGRLLFSVEHPVLLAPSEPSWKRYGSTGEPFWPLDRYLNEGDRSVAWLGSHVLKQHRTVATYLNLLLESGFALDRIEEWSPSEEQIRARPDWAIERHRPYFLLISAQCGRPRMP